MVVNPGHQRFPEDAGHGKRVDCAGMIVLKVGAERIVHSTNVGVGIYQAEHNSMIPCVNNPCVQWDRYLIRGSHSDYPVTGDHDGSWAIGFPSRGIEYGGILQDQCFGHIILIANGIGAAAWALSNPASRAIKGSRQYYHRKS